MLAPLLTFGASVRGLEGGWGETLALPLEQHSNAGGGHVTETEAKYCFWACSTNGWSA